MQCCTKKKARRCDLLAILEREHQPQQPGELYSLVEINVEESRDDNETSEQEALPATVARGAILLRLLPEMECMPSWGDATPAVQYTRTVLRDVICRRATPGRHKLDVYTQPSLQPFACMLQF